MKRTALLIITLMTLCLALTGCGKLKVGDSVQIGKIQDLEGEEAIWWEIIAVDGNRALVISREIVDWKLFNEEYANVTWETSTIRNWLNDTFYNSTFSSDERARILTTTIDNPDNPASGIDGGNSTEDRLFLLSVYEVKEYFSRDAEAWLSYQAHQSAEEYNPGAYIAMDERWWTRTPGNDAFSFLCVCDELLDVEFDSFPTGLATEVYTYSGIVVNDAKNGGGVRPAMWIKR